MSASERKAIIYTSLTRSMYVGRLERVLTRASAASTLLVSIEDELELIDPSHNQRFRSKSFLIPSGMKVSIDTHDSKVALCFLDDLGTDLARLVPQMKTTLKVDNNYRLYSDIYQEQEIISHADYVLAKRPSDEVVLAQFENWITAFSPSVLPIIDERVQQAVLMIKSNCNKNLPVSDVAKCVGLSVPRLTQLFKQVTGVPIRRFRLWQRIISTGAKLAQGLSLTDAAIASGFSDYAQFSRVFREFNGASPSAAKNNTEIRILA